MNKIIKVITGAVVLFVLFSCGSSKHSSSANKATVRIVTTEGEIIVQLYNETPLHRDNFLRLVKNKTYDGVIFHRVIANFMIQGGDPGTRTEDQKNKNKNATPEYTIPAEIRTPALYHKKGALAAARMGDSENPQRASSGYQFYIVKGKKFTQKELTAMQSSKIKQYQKMDEQEADSLYKFSGQASADYLQLGGTPHLDGNYTVFGEVIKGQEVVDKISELATKGADRPVDDVRIINPSCSI